MIVFPGIDPRSAGNRRCQTDDNGVFANQYHWGNRCMNADGNFYSWSNCNSGNLRTTVYETWSNTLFSPNGQWSSTCGLNSFSAWQNAGQDKGSTLGNTPTIPQILTMAASVLN